MNAECTHVEETLFSYSTQRLAFLVQFLSHVYHLFAVLLIRISHSPSHQNKDE
jgi:hypothetical protein